MSRSCGYTGTAHRCRRFYITNLMPVDARRGERFLTKLIYPLKTALCVNEVNRRVICTLSEFITRYLRVQQLIRLSLLKQNYQPYSPGWGLPTHRDCPLSYFHFRRSVYLRVPAQSAFWSEQWESNPHHQFGRLEYQPLYDTRILLLSFVSYIYIIYDF